MMNALLLAAALVPMGPPEPPSREDVARRSFPGLVTEDEISRRMRVSKAVGWTLTACDVATTLTIPNTREVGPLAFGSKPLGAAISTLATWRALALEESLLRRQHRGWADVIRWGRALTLVGACGWNLSVAW